MNKTEHLKIEQIQVYELVPYDKNPRINEKAITAVAESIEKWGFNQPILIDQDNRIAAGHTRWEAAKLLNMMSIPCVRRSMTEAEFIGYNLADNKTGELATWDKKELAECMRVLDDLSALEIPGFSDAEIDKLFGLNGNAESTTAAAADFGAGEHVSEEKDPDDEARIKTLKLNFASKQYREVNGKLKAIMKTHKLDTMADALIKALEGFQAAPTTVIKRAPVKVTV